MNTLSKQHTSKFFATGSDYLTFRQHWAGLVNSERKHQLKAPHHLLFLILSGKDWRKAFTFPANSNKLRNGYQPELYRAFQLLGVTFFETQNWVLAPFDGLVTVDSLAEARKYLAHLFQSYREVGHFGRVYGSMNQSDAYTELNNQLEENQK